MELEHAIRQSGIIPPSKVPSLLAAIARTPGDYSWFITPPHSLEDRLQGDVIASFPFAVVDESGSPMCKPAPVVLMNNTCDLQPNRSSYVVVAPLIDFDVFSAIAVQDRGEDRAKGFLQTVRANKVHELLWLPSFGPFVNGAVVLLDRLGAASVNLYELALREKRRLASLSQNGFYYFLMKVTNYFARAETSDVQR